ncbi:macrolide family glycosyltransferase [Streptomyces netropsis]|uniref:macrolide family glycosyltransferase n=1 Tax=Streptomyces netropsis TaxID=55404 RepID=UPI003787C9A2
MSAVPPPARPSADQAHIAVFNVPQHGHVYPTLGLVAELVRRGHRVSYATTAAFAEAVRAVGAVPIICRGTVSDLVEAPEALSEGAALAVEDMTATLPQLSEAFGRDRPDLVLYDVYAWAGPALAAGWGVPSVLLSPSHLPYEGLARDMFGVEDLAQTPTYPRLASVLAEYGVRESLDELLNAPHRAVAFLPRAFQRKAHTVAVKDCVWAGPVLGGRSFQGRWAGPDDDRPVLLVSLGSQFTRRPGFFRTCLDAFGGTPWHVVMAVGSRVGPAELGGLPPNVEVHAHAPQLAVLSQASAFVTHGGMGSVMEALSFGVPLVAVPQMAEQRVNAEQIQALSLGCHLPREQVTPETLLASVASVAQDARVAEGVAAMRREIGLAGGAATAGDAVERALTDRGAAPLGPASPVDRAAAR